MNDLEYPQTADRKEIFPPVKNVHVLVDLMQITFMVSFTCLYCNWNGY